MIMVKIKVEAIIVSTLEANLELLSTIPEDHQEEIRRYLLINFCGNNPYKPLTKKEITEELAASRTCYQNGDGEDFEKALDEIGAKYGL
jgi:hypothetical protein